jgi:lipoprotein-releasing system permease protein
MSERPPVTRPFAGFEWLLALRYLRSRRREGFISVISLFSFLGIMLGVATLIVVMAVFNGFRDELLDKVLGFGGHATVYHANLSPIVDYKERQALLDKIPGVTFTYPMVEGQAMVSSTRSSTGAMVRGMREGDMARLKGLANKDLITDMDLDGQPDAAPSFTGFEKTEGIAIGERMAWRHQVGIGQTITLISPDGEETAMGTTPRIREYPIAAIFKMGMSEYDENVAYLPMALAQEYFNLGEGVTGIEIETAEPEKVAALLPAIRAAIGPDMTVNTWQDRNKAFFSAVEVERNVMFLVLTMIILVAALNIISGLIMLVKDKGRDIAILRTMGATRGAIQRVFFLTGAAIGVVGTLAGTVLGLVICLNIEHIRRFIQWLSGTDPFNAEIYYLSQLPAKLESGQTLLIVLMAMALSFLATLYPSWKAAKLDPVEALRYE